MKINRTTKILTVVASLSLLLGACGNSDNNDGNNNDNGGKGATENTQQTEVKITAGAEMQDGTYTLNEKDFDDNGWKTTFEMIVKDGKITESNYNYVNEDGNLKSEDEGYQKAMSDKVGTGPKDFIPQLNDGLVASQNADQVEVVSGASHSSEAFKNYAQQLIQAAQKGDTTTIEIDNMAPLKDGVYSLEEKNIGSTGWKTFINMTVAGGKITTVDYNYLNADGDLKTEDEGYQETMKEKSGVGPQDFVPALSAALIEKQNPADVEVVSGATHSSHTFKLYTAQLVNAAQKGDTSKIIIDNFVYED
ncbi:extracellular electron transfer flavoprotein PplA [Bacillus niameyensis]|uniref:extracellular electron transfer flavoprotein PplA n=1 Tax=Bacillus niameyensis TaxID=1522308 RepID=UPI00078043A4|nr:extracellular electron transfer flavoprotein PplA [Bacillus niameyensis]